MKHWTLIVIVALCLFAGCAARTPEEATRQQDAHYRSRLRPYWQDLKAGMTRKEVEDYLRAKNIPFTEGCCYSSEEPYLWDAIDHRTENRPWPCGSADVYIGFAFSPRRHSSLTTIQPAADDADVLVGVHIIRLVDCV